MNAPDKASLSTSLNPFAASDLSSWWMPFTANRQFKAHPRMLARAKGMFYWTDDGREILDGTAGLWCVNAGHGREEIARAVSEQVETLDFAPSFQFGHPNVDASVALTALPMTFGKDHVERLRKVGLDDAAIADLIGAASFFNWANRLMLSLGVPATQPK